MVAAAPRRFTYAEYMAIAEAADVKQEYIAGEIVAMAGGTIEHGRLMVQMIGLVRDALRGKPSCIVLPSDVRVRIRSADRATYPDLHVVCSEIERDPEDRVAVVNPTLIVEITSPSTVKDDRGDKFEAYRELPSLQQYVTVAQHHRRIEVYTRQAGRRWILEEFRPGESLRLSSVDIELAVDDVYTDALGPILPTAPT